MPITRKDSILKQYYEASGQQIMFGYDNLEFKTVNHPRKHKLLGICQKFKLKKIKTSKIKFSFIEISNVNVIGYL